MSLDTLRRRLGWWLLGWKHHDVDIKQGDWITHVGWRHAPVQVVDFNDALCAVAVRLGTNGGIVVWPMDPTSRVVQKPASDGARAREQGR